MGYTTDFSGSFALNKPLLPEHKAYLNAFASTRRMQRNAVIVKRTPDPIRKAAGLLDVGWEGGYFVGGTGFCGQDHDDSVVDSNLPPQWTTRPVVPVGSE